MKSNACVIEKGKKDIGAIFKECEKVAAYNELTHKQALQLRLLCEELDGMLPQIVGDFKGVLWFEFEGKLCNVKASVDLAEISQQSRQDLIAVAKNNKNASVKGVVDRIRAAIENYFLDDDLCDMPVMSSSDLNMAYGYCDAMDYSYYWSLERYRTNTKREEKTEAWDELEKSVIASVADDVIIGVKGRHADITIVKNFA